MSSQRESIASLQLGRAVAALAVVLHHSEQAANAFTSGADITLFGWGLYGVDFFFVLSGFIIYHVHSRDFRGLEAARIYALKRILRIYVPYLPIGLGMVALYSVLPNLSAADRDWGLLTSATLLPTSSPPALSVAWTLVYEMMFYAIFLVFYFTRHFWFIITFWALAVIGGQWLSIMPTSPVLSNLLQPIVLEFICGMLAALVAGRISHRFGVALLIPGLVGIVVFVVMILAGSETHRAWLGPPLACIVVALVSLEKAGYFRPNTRFVLFLGSASYAIYLVHNPLASLFARILRPADSWIVTLGGCVLAGILFGCIYHILWERPVLDRIRRIFGHRQPNLIEARE